MELCSPLAPLRLALLGRLPFEPVEPLAELGKAVGDPQNRFEELPVDLLRLCRGPL